MRIRIQVALERVLPFSSFSAKTTLGGVARDTQSFLLKSRTHVTRISWKGSICRRRRESVDAGGLFVELSYHPECGGMKVFEEQ